jgi:hypothetical protein
MQGEKVWADGGYRGDQTILHGLLPGLTRGFKRETARGRARHETINGRFTNWSALRDVYRHDLSKYYPIFGAVAIFAQIEMLHGFAPFQCFSQHDSVVTDSLNETATVCGTIDKMQWHHWLVINRHHHLAIDHIMMLRCDMDIKD